METEQPSGLQLVLIGASAGGVEALAAILGSLTPDLQAAVVIAQHLDPSRTSNLATVLARRSQLPVVLVERDAALEAAQVYVIPSGHHVAIRDGHVELEDHYGDRPKPSIDHLFSSAAGVYGERLTAVVLTGRGADGAAGAVDVKHAGGTVIVQNPHTAAFASMPLAVPPTVVDHVVDLEGIGPLLELLVAGATLPASTTPQDDTFVRVLELVGTTSNVDFRSYKPATLLRRIGRRMALRHIVGLPEYLAYLEAHPEELRDLTRSLLIKVTEFFRDADAFAYLRREVVPLMIERGRERGRSLRLWSAGCATGEEAYSLALLLAEALGAELSEWSVKVFATDLDEDAINFARRGLYPASVVRDVPVDLMQKYFEPVDQGFRVHKTLRQLVIFGQQDLSRGVPFPRIDLVVCRNLLIYFQPELQQNVLDLFAYSLHGVQGYLFLGKAETARPSKSAWELVNKRWKVYRCVAGPIQGPSPALPRVADSRSPALPAAPRHDLRRPEAADLGLQQIRRLAETLLRHLPTGIVLVDRNYRIVSVNGAARRLLTIRDVSPENQDFLHTARGLPYADLRDAIDRVLRDRAELVLPDVRVEGPLTNEQRYVCVNLALLQTETGDTVMLAISDATDLVHARQRLETLTAEHRRLSEDLGNSNRRLGDTNKELQDANEELQAANEEMMLAQEELQATNEEFEATNEELQATNEELETNNEELQATNEELETTNEELTARTAELQEATRILHDERRRLAQVVEKAPVPVLVLQGPALVVEVANRPARTLLDGADGVGKPFEEVCKAPELAELVRAVRECYRSGRDWRGESEGRVFSVVPTRDADGGVDGVLVYMVASGG